MKKEYINPYMVVVEVKAKNNLLTTSDVDYSDETHNGYFD